MKTSMTFAAATALTLGAAACRGDFLTGGALSNNPNVANTATEQNLFTGTQVAEWAELGSDMSRVTMIWAQHLSGNNQQYVNIDQYGVSEQTTNGFHQALYLQGGLVDMRHLETAARAVHDSLFLGVAQVQEAWMMGEGADLFGALVYSHALTGERNPPVDPQHEVYAHVEALLDTAIANMAATSGINVGPGATDLSYGGDPGKWTDLAYTLKARFYLHQLHAPYVGQRQDTLAARALAAAQRGLEAGEDYNAVWSGNALQQNYWYQFEGPAGRIGYYIPSSTLIDTLRARGDSTTLLTSYFNADQSDLADARLQPNSPQTFASHVENLLLWAEAAYRTGDQATALAKLKQAREAEGVVDPDFTTKGVPTGLALLHAILLEKWISDFELGTEAWTDYRRTCTPNLAPTVPGGKIPGRLFYDSGERQTNTNIPVAGQGINGFYNEAQPPLATSDGSGLACLAQ